MVTSALAAAVIGQSAIQTPRLQRESPFPALHSVRINSRLASHGIAQGLARANNLQARVLWVDGSANLDKVATDKKARKVVQNAADAGFNTIVFDVKPIVGRTLYPSKLTPQMTEWKGRTMPEGHDPLAVVSEECKKLGLSLYISLNAFAEGHSYSKRDADKPDTLFGDPGWGYEHPELQTWQYTPMPVLRLGPGSSESVEIHSKPDPSEWDEPIAVFLRKTPTSGELFAFADSAGEFVLLSDTPIKAVKGGVVYAAGPAGAVFLREAFERSAGPIVDSKAEFAPIAERQTQIPLMMNPHHPDVQGRALAFVTEILEGYDVDGIIYDDRLRFGGLNTDFSAVTRSKFEKHVGREVLWPDEVFKLRLDFKLNTISANSSYVSLDPGPLFEEWLAWRASEMAAFVTKVRATARDTRPGSKIGVYAGSWYGDYAKYGNNYGSNQLEAGFPFLTRAYKKAGFAQEIDFLITGCYYPLGTMHQAGLKAKPPGRTVEAGGLITNRVVRDQTWAYAGIMLSDYKDPAMLESALQAAAATTQGVMVFDYSHDIDQHWPMFKRAFSVPAKAPHQTDLLSLVRERRKEWDANGYKDPPFPLLQGAPGAGF